MSYSGTLKVDNITTLGGVGTLNITTANAIDGTLLAWVIIGNTSALGMTILQSHNVSSVTNITTGQYQIDFPQGLMREGAYYGITGGGTESAQDGVAGSYLTAFDTNTKTSSYCQVAISDRANVGQIPLEFLVAFIQ